MPVRLSIRPPDSKLVAKVVIVEDGKVLLLKRKKNQKFPEQWDLPGGHLLVGEDWEQGAKREVEEETNLKISNMKFVSSEKNKKFFKADSWDNEMFQKEHLPEHDDFIWIDIDKISELNNLSDIYLSAIRKAFK